MGRIYFKQLPHFRFLFIDDHHNLMGQVGLDYSVMNLNGQPIKALGVIDLCVSKASRCKGIGSLLLAEIDNFCKNKSVDFILLSADCPDLYIKAGHDASN